MKLAVIEGDGIGREVIPAAVCVLDAFCEKFGWTIEKVKIDVGYGKWEKIGEAITDEDIRLMKACDAVLFGAVTTVNDPSYKSVVLRMRKELDLFANIRPVKPLRGIYDMCGIRDRKEEAVDMIIVRENTEGLYSGLEEIGDAESRTTRIVTKAAAERIAAAAGALASERRGIVTIVHKSNVIKSDKLFVDTCQKTLAEKYPDVVSNMMLVDACAYDIIMHPEKYDVIVTTNLFGDILSDLAAVHLGSIGLAPSANLGERYALFEPVHGSAPDIAGQGIADPFAAIRCLGMMFERMDKEGVSGAAEAAALLTDAMEAAIFEKNVTPDLGGELSTADAASWIADYVKKH